jgi:hypothetical protein
MDSRATLSRHGRTDVFTRTRSKREAAGFHGTVVVYAAENVVGGPVGGQ